MKELGGEEGERESQRALGLRLPTQPSIMRTQRRSGRRESDFALQALFECRAAKMELVRTVLRWQSNGSKVRPGLPVGL